MKHLAASVFLFLGIIPLLVAQPKDEASSVKQTIDKLFTGMQKGDSTMVRECFSKEIALATIVINKSGETKLVRENSLDGFLKAVGTPHKEVWYEEYWNLDIQVAGSFATAFCDYAFYVENTFSHCGVDAFHFIKEKDGWKIFHLTDTRQKEGCNVPQEIQDKHKN